ncbi:NAD(P)/FAD-dependent oxidoreductase [Segnochrobactrum spirostomi]|uniref:NAD(P)/FAD-dependent oxidoreductase n=1 Tax=Segnochrobactrum spirostomi TaxID=2608987 RepID=A0A6A7Y9Z4_9HYPH|nr:NAD(P)/FAD-dependent oxidoreductase [Segnochrobactrum spirostomi]MQT14791.1 NAD(P)/FAD-dependent oxidoreductase [Segnochrobactrum spirostomi]
MTADDREVAGDFECVVIGGGVVGLAVARALALAGIETLLVEKEARFGTATSSRNSGVVHSGIYYPKDSLKARLCVEGRDRLYAYAAAKGVPVRRCGKIIVATTEAEIATLDHLIRRAVANGVTDLAFLSGAEAAALEPDVAAVAALLSPSTGIVDTQALIDALEADATAAGATLALHSRALRIAPEGGRIVTEIESDGMARIASRWVINAAGLAAPEIAGAVADARPESRPTAYYARGNYFAYSGATRFSHLVYPVPEPGGLGIHLTLDLAGGVRFGPDVEWIEAIDYGVNPARKEAFVRSIRRYWPAIDPDRLQPAYSGIRPKIAPPGTEAPDFLIQRETDHGVPGLIHLLGIESPGLTASLAIAAHVCGLVTGRTSEP